MEFFNKVHPDKLTDNLHLHILREQGTRGFVTCPIETSPNPNWYILRLVIFAGDGHSLKDDKKNDGFYTIIPRSQKFTDACGQYKDLIKLKKSYNGYEKPYIEYYIPFNTEEELKNFWNYIHTNFVRICLWFIKTNLHLDNGELKYIPWFDFSNSVFEGSTEDIDNALFKKYNISQDIINHILDILPNCYNLDLDKYKQKGLIVFDGKEYDKCEEITKFSDDDLLMEFKSIIEPLLLNDNFRKHIAAMPGSHYPVIYETNPNPNWFVISIPRIRGHKDTKTGLPKDDFYTLISNDKNFIKTNVLGIYKELLPLYYFPFIDKNTCINTFKYIQTFFARTCLYFVKNNVELVGGGPLEGIPYFNFNDPIFNGSPEDIDIALFKKYNISQDIINHILELIPNYYNLDLSKYKI